MQNRFVLRSFGLEGLRENMRRGIKLGEEFATLLRGRPDLFKVISGPQLGVVAFQIKATPLNGTSQSHERNNRLTLQVCQAVNDSTKAYLTGCTIDNLYVIRMVTTHASSTSKSIRLILDLIIQAASRGVNGTS